MSNRIKLEVLVKDIQKAKSEIADINKQIFELNNEKRQLSKYVVSLEKKMKNAQIGDVVVSDHALLRYIQREMGLNIEHFKKKMLTESLIEEVKKNNGKGIIEHEKVVYVLSNYVVMSVYPKSEKK